MKKKVFLLFAIISSIKTDHIFFDLHDVILERNENLTLKEHLALFLSLAPKNQRITLRNELLSIFTPSNAAKILYKAYWQGQKWDYIENYVNTVTPNKPLVRSTFLKFMDVIFKEKKKTVAILQELVEAGHTLHILSNIGPETLAIARKENMFPHLFNETIFKNPKNSINNELPALQKDGTREPVSIWKPMEEAYATALLNTGAEAKNSWMVDDKEKNNPQQFGWKGFFHFTTPEQFRRDLVRKGLLNKKNKGII